MLAPAAATWDQGSDAGDVVEDSDSEASDDGSDDGKEVEQLAVGIRQQRRGANTDAVLVCEECGEKSDQVDRSRAV